MVCEEDNMSLAKQLKGVSFAQIALYASLFLVGIFHVYLSCILAAALLVALCLYLIKKGGLKIKWSLGFISILVLVACYALTPLWAVDSGEAIFGFFKFLPLPLYSLLLMQEEGGRERVISGLPYVAAVQAVISTALMFVPDLSTFFAVSGRLSGFVQYPNTFAMILLVSELILITKEKPSILDYICISVLLFAVLYTGSRMVFVLAAISNLVAIFTSKNKKLRLVVLAFIGGGIVLVLLYCLIADKFSILTRYLNISVLESTFVGRILYTQDILPTVLKNPFGIGYMGYYFIQRSVQTGVYSLMFIHNDLLQIAIDVGWIPCILLISSVVMTFINRKVSLRNKIILATMFAHALFDFDLMYIAVFMIFILFIQTKELKEQTLKGHTAACVSLAAVLGGASVYFGIAQSFTRFEMHRAATDFYPLSTISQTALIKDASTPGEEAEIGEEILKRNKYVSVAYSAVGRYAYSKGDFGKLIEYKKKAIEAAPFAAGEYNEYAEMLLVGIQLYTKAGDQTSADFCVKELFALEEMHKAQKNKVSQLGSMIDLQHELYFPRRIQEQIDALRQEG